MKQAKPIIATAVVLCVAMVNAGVLHAVHMHQHSTSRSASGGSPPAGHHHDPSTCPFCIQFASGNKTVSPDFGGPVSFTLGPVQDVISFWTFFLPSVSLPSSPARAPPSICL
ncbi:MAG: DUF2946 family protein [Phycisphaerae bacterium]|nr:DUF2946 family protein [Phycisphaerae bacterium]